MQDTCYKLMTVALLRLLCTCFYLMLGRQGSHWPVKQLAQHFWNSPVMVGGSYTAKLYICPLQGFRSEIIYECFFV